MMLQFTQAGSAWACEFEVTDKTNLHIENAEGILLYQRTAAGKFALIKDAPTSTGPVFDYDLEGLVYPKHIRVICSSLPTYAEVVSDGEITEIKSQTKEVEVTANGTTQVAPDAGYSYLTGVTVKTNVPQSGGSGGGTEASSMEYLDISSLNLVRKMMFLNLCVVAKFAESIISPFAYLAAYQTDLPTTATDATMVAIDFGAKVYSDDTLLTVKEVLFSPGFNFTEETLAAIPRITEEQFYTI